MTGGFGLIGAHTARALLDLGERCVIAGRRATVPPDLLADSDVIAAQMDCTDFDGVLDVGRRHPITGIVHLAAAGLGGAPLDELSANTQALFTMLRAAQTWGVSRFVLASTIGVYAGVTGGVYREDAPLPIPTGHVIPAYKKSADIMAGVVAASIGLDVFTARIGAIWGPVVRGLDCMVMHRCVYTSTRVQGTHLPACR